MADAVDLKPLAPREALAFFRQKGYRPTFSYLEMMHQAHADAFTVAGVMRLDVLQDLRGAMDEALAGGQTLGEFKKAAQEKLAAKGWWGPVTVKDPATGEAKIVDLSSSKRLRIIFNTNLRTSYSAGYWARVQRTKAALPYLRYSAVLDKKTRPLHRRWGNLSAPVILPIDDPWWKTHFPPNGWNCRCTVVQMTARQVDRAGWRVQPEGPNDGPDKTFRNARTGEAFTVPPGIDPSFAYNVGETANFPDPAKYSDQAIGQQSALLSVASPAFARLVAGEIAGTAPVAWVDQAVASALKVDVHRVDLSADTIAKQARAHADIGLPEYQQLPELLQGGLVVPDPSDPSVMRVFGVLVDAEAQRRLYSAVVKRTASGQALFLVSFRKANARQLTAALAASPIRDQAALRELKVGASGLVE